jgi:PAS domain S-box-containing protein
MQEAEIHFESSTTLEDSLREYKKFFEEATVGLCRIDIKSGRFLMVNPYCAQMLGYACPEDMINSGDTITKLCGKEEKQKLLSRLRKEGCVGEYELKIDANGKTIWVSAFIHVNCGGTCLQGTLINITNHKKNEFEIEVIKAKQLLKLNGIREKLDNMIMYYDQ